MSSPAITNPRGAAPRQAGFTLLEIMVVMLVLGLITRLVITNLGTFLPDASLDSQANQFRSWLDFLRSEAKIQGKPYTLELDLDENLTRLILPEEDKLVTTPDDTLAATIPQRWTTLAEERVQFHGHAISGREIITRGKVKITFDESGFTADQSIYFRYGDEDSRLVWTVHLHGLSGATRVVRDHEKKRNVFTASSEADF